MATLFCPKCKDMFRKQERLDKHVAKCPGKVCRVCGQIGHLACGIGMNGKEFLEKLKKEGKQPIRIIGIFDGIETKIR